MRWRSGMVRHPLLKICCCSRAPPYEFVAGLQRTSRETALGARLWTEMAARRRSRLALLLSLACGGSLASQEVPHASRVVRLRRWAVDHREELVHCCIMVCTAQQPISAIIDDTWTVLKPVEAATTRGAIFRNRRRAAQVAQFVGGIYTPRIVFLAGMMIRSLQMSTKLRYGFDPSTGYAAGAMLAAHWTQREWLPVILIGWGVGGAYWSAFSVRPPGVSREDAPLCSPFGSREPSHD